jgi:hypothetical protein
MSSIPPAQKRLGELIARYRFEPTIRDVFVEGRADANLVTKFLQSQNLKDVAVYEISSVEISAERLIEAGHSDGARQRVIFLALYCKDNLPLKSCAVTCVADRDYDLLLGKSYDCPFLLFWDHCCLEMYAFDSRFLDPVLRSAAPSLQKSGDTVLSELEPVLLRLFAIRTTNIWLGLGLEWLPSFPDSCTLTSKSVEFDESDFIDRYLSKNARLKEKENFLRELKILTSKMSGDRRQFIRGHDFVAALSWYLRKSTSKSSVLHRPEVLMELLIANIEPSRVSTEQFFRQLVARVSGSDCAGSGATATH